MSVIEDRAHAWLRDRAEANERIVRSTEAPGDREIAYLERRGFLLRAAKGHYAVKRPEDSADAVADLLYWPAVNAVFSARHDWALRGRSALSAHVGDASIPDRLTVRTNDASNHLVRLFGRHPVLLRAGGFDLRLTATVELGGEQIRVDLPEVVLVDLSDRTEDLRYRAFVSGTRFEMSVLEAIYRRKPTPVRFRRASALARELGREDLAAMLDRIVGMATAYAPVSLAAVPLAPTPVLTRPWERIQSDQIAQFAEAIESAFSARIGGLETRTLEDLITAANESKRYDVYHSTSIEGYRVTPDEVSILLAGAQARTGGDPAQVENRMAVLGYSRAFDLVLERAHTDSGSAEVTESTVKDVYSALFGPSVEAGIIDPLDLVEYRGGPVFIKASAHIPPAAEKVPGLMRTLHESLRLIPSAFTQAVLWHYGFVTIHPYVDGNGRTARLLMNYRLVTAGQPWVTIQNDRRFEYFDALSAGQTGGDILPFAEFILGYIEAAVTSG
jgi:Fic family protein